MKKQSSQLQKGEKAEQRFIKIARSLESINPTTLLKIWRVRKASLWLDKVGIDVMIKLIDGDRIIRVPVQVKSSYYTAEQFCRKYPEYVKAGVIVSVVNDAKTDLEIAEELIQKLFYILVFQRDFEALLGNLKDRKKKIIRDLVENRHEKRRRNQKKSR